MKRARSYMEKVAREGRTWRIYSANETQGAAACILEQSPETETVLDDATENGFWEHVGEASKPKCRSMSVPVDTLLRWLEKKRPFGAVHFHGQPYDHRLMTTVLRDSGFTFKSKQNVTLMLRVRRNGFHFVVLNWEGGTAMVAGLYGNGVPKNEAGNVVIDEMPGW